MAQRPKFAITMGDPAGIGAETIISGFHEITNIADPIVIGDCNVVDSAIEVSEASLTTKAINRISDAQFEDDVINVLDLKNVREHEWGALREDFGAASLEYIEKAVDLSLEKEVDAMVTAPINKQATKLAGSQYAGHTGLIADKTDTAEYSMMLIEGDLRVTHVSTHVPLQEACDIVTRETVLNTIKVTDKGLKDIGVEDPHIGVAGLNPHAGDGGLLGDKDQNEIDPAVEQARKGEINVTGPESPDTVYVRAADGEFDCVVSMYHDQGHIPIKMLGFSSDGSVSGVNMTIGVPIVRTSVDHGTAFDIAGQGIASSRSMVDACEVAVEAVRGNALSK